jgi:uncharacterized membrane protein YhaH (DUF805 family)
MKWYLRVLKKYANFGGRARRKEYWMFMLFHLLIVLLLGGLDIALEYAGDKYYLLPIYVILTLVPHASVVVRRLHDTGRSAWWLLLAIVPAVLSWLILLFVSSPSSLGEPTAGTEMSPVVEMLMRIIPAIGGVWLLILMFMEGDWEANEYGEDPKKLSDIELKESAVAYSNYELYKNNLITYSVVVGVVNMVQSAVFRYKASMGTMDYLNYKPVFFMFGLLFAILPLLLCFLVKKRTLRIVLIPLAIIEVILLIYSTLELMS